MKLHAVPRTDVVVLAPVVLMLVTGCASIQRPDDAAPGAPASEQTITSTPTEAPGTDESGEGSAFADAVKAGLDPALLPAGFSLVGTLDTPRDAQPAQLYGTSRYAAAQADPSKDMGEVVTVRLVPTSPAARASEPEPADGVRAEARDDLAPGAVLYTLVDTGDESITIPAGDDYDVIVATNADSVDMLVPFAEVITR